MRPCATRRRRLGCAEMICVGFPFPRLLGTAHGPRPKQGGHPGLNVGGRSEAQDGSDEAGQGFSVF